MYTTAFALSGVSPSRSSAPYHFHLTSAERAAEDTLIRFLLVFPDCGFCFFAESLELLHLLVKPCKDSVAVHPVRQRLKPIRLEENSASDILVWFCCVVFDCLCNDCVTEPFHRAYFHVHVLVISHRFWVFLSSARCFSET